MEEKINFQKFSTSKYLQMIQSNVHVSRILLSLFIAYVLQTMKSFDKIQLVHVGIADIQNTIHEKWLILKRMKLLVKKAAEKI